MMIDRIYFYIPGACSFSAMPVLEWLKEPYQLCAPDKAARQTAQYRAINPLGRVPALKERNQCIYENIGILTYLATIDPNRSYIPADGSIPFGQAIQWLSYLTSTFHIAFQPFFNPARFIADESLHKTIKENGQKLVEAELAFVNEHFSKNQFMLGDDISVVDPYLFAMARWAKWVDMEKSYPHIARFQSEMKKNEGVKIALQLEEGADPKNLSHYCLGRVALNAV